MCTPRTPDLTLTPCRSKKDKKPNNKKSGGVLTLFKIQWLFPPSESQPKSSVAYKTLPSVPGYLSDLISSHPPCVHSAGPAASLLVLKLRRHRGGPWFVHWLPPVPGRLRLSLMTPPLLWFLCLYITCMLPANHVPST